MSGSPRTHAFRVILWVSLLAAACGGESGLPTSPSNPDGVGTGATIEGQVSGASASVGLTVSVTESAVSAPIGADGRFTLDQVPPGTVRLRFVGPGVDALLDVGVVSAGQVLRITVMVTGSNAALVAAPPPPPGTTQFDGALTSLGGACPLVTFRVDAILIRTSEATTFDGGCTNLSNGDQVRGEGVPQPDGSVLATSVVVDESGTDAPGDVAQIAGVLSSLGGACPSVTFRLGDTLVRTSAATHFRSDCTTLSNGDQVRVEGVQQPDGSVQATDVEVDAPVDPSPPGGGPDPPDVHPAGTLMNLGGTCPIVTFTLSGTVVNTSASTVFDDGGCAALANGSEVRVDGVLQPDGSVLATDVEVDQPAGGDPPTQEDLEGVLTSLGGACPTVTFRVNGTQIRTSTATVFDGGGCAALTNGAQVRVRGFLQPDGSVLAGEVELDTPDEPPDPGGLVLTLEMDPDEWRLEWAQGSQSGSGGANVTAEIRGSRAQQIAPGSVMLSGPSGSVSPVNTDAKVDRFEAEFAKIEVIGVIGNAIDGGTVAITISGTLLDGTAFNLAQQVAIRE